MVEKILAYERDLFFMLNGSDSPFLDRFMWLFSGKAVWLPLAAFILIVLLYKKKWKESILILLGIVFVVTLCDQFASHVCKPIFTRFRPTHHPDFMDQVKTVFDYRGGRYGFISSHAANAFGFATYMSLLFRYRLFTWTIFLWAALTAYTRVYLGVHFISDIVPGAIAGVFFGWLVYWLYVKVHPVVTGSDGKVSAIYSDSRKRIIVYAIFITTLLIAIFNVPLAGWLR
ncbi:phosphatase PAP2 family protein [Parabacteroides sp. TM07-1AC]|uniref:phosphatase PAP2 family protein n=1 Tax=Parabacteroides sp. TM07-1AC TaxID=2292363 RepID=UPI000EFDF8EB|nr:phosphatase PAP2 family protein [Parabacteroides sp. TM07-1AC]RHU30443.1 phosphatase PAP2 family protein [Parabacteroides sp. TM07-1AC]